MFYRIEVKDYIRVPPELFGESAENAILKRVKSKYEGVVSKDLGSVIDVSKVIGIKEGVIIPGDGAAYYETEFELITFKPEMKEVVFGKIKDIADFGAFVSMGAMEGMVHISQTMDDFVSFSKDKTLAGKDSKRVLKLGDLCKARVIAVSFKDASNPKIGLTMRQPWLGKLEWMGEPIIKPELPKKKEKKRDKRQKEE
ncbi:MAG: DNA-directed RNA polymerase [Candidatus Woesearchaeota archaeon]|nr:DNA-directed RNA polymerase [Candidatus Woesearchaeota archaeon]